MALNAQWLLQDNAASTTVVASVGTNGTLTSAGNTSASTQTPGPGTFLTRALQFDGTNDYVACTTGNAAVLTNKAVATISLWFKTSSSTASDRRMLLVSTAASAGTARASVGFNSSHQVAVYARAGDGESTQTKLTTATNLNDGSWHHLLAVINYAGDATTIYIDGTSVSQSGTISFTTGTSGTSDSAGVTIASANTGGNYFPGQLADVRIYDSDESANVAAIMDEADIAADVTPPILEQATIGVDGVTVTLDFDEDVDITDASGWTLTPTGAAVTLTYASGTGTSQVTMTSSRAILSSDAETATIQYSSTTGNTEDTSGNALATLSATAVINTSAQEASGLGTTPIAPDTFDVPYLLPTGGTTYTPADSAALTTALAAAVGGDVIVLDHTATYTGNFKLRDWGAGTDWIYIISDSLSSLPSFGTRVDLDDIGDMPTITSSSNAPVHSDFGAHHYRFAGVRIVTGAADRLAAVQLGYGGDYSTNASEYDELPHHITFDRCVIGSTSDDHRLRHGITGSGRYIAVVHCYIYNCKDSADAQAIFVHNGSGPFLIQNNFLEATGENVMFGGSDPGIPGLVPSDIVIRGNHFFKRLAWDDGGVLPWNPKNLLEFKNARRALVTGNVFENCWTAGQTGIAMLLTVRNQGGSAEWSIVKDIDIQNNKFTNVGGGINVTGGDNLQTSQQTRRIRINNTLMVDVTSDFNSSPRFLHTGIATGQPVLDLTVTHNTWLAPADEAALNNAINFANTGINVDGFTWTDNIATHGSYSPDWAKTDNSTHTNNVLIMIPADSRYATNKSAFATQHPDDFMSDPENDSVGFVDWEAGNYRLDASSQWKGGGTLGSDPGFNQDQLEAAIAGAISGEWPASGQNPLAAAKPSSLAAAFASSSPLPIL